jgi:hypothetical protein
MEGDAYEETNRGLFKAFCFDFAVYGSIFRPEGFLFTGGCGIHGDLSGSMI